MEFNLLWASQFNHRVLSSIATNAFILCCCSSPLRNLSCIELEICEGISLFLCVFLLNLPGFFSAAICMFEFDVIRNMNKYRQFLAWALRGSHKNRCSFSGKVVRYTLLSHIVHAKSTNRYMREQRPLLNNNKRKLIKHKSPKNFAAAVVRVHSFNCVFQCAIGVTGRNIIPRPLFFA